MKIAVSIGNTNTAILLNGNSFSIPTHSYRHENELFSILSPKTSGFQNVQPVMASVAPEKTEIVKAALYRLFGIRPMIVDLSTPLGLDLSRYDVSLLGIDRLVACYSAMQKYPLPIAVFDLGTATTANVVNRSLEFLGGAIMPGVQIMLDALAAKTSQLPPVHAKDSALLLGGNTAECLMAGAINSTIGFIELYRERLRALLGADTSFVITGGNAPVVLKNGLTGIRYEPDLILEGLMHIAF